MWSTRTKVGWTVMTLGALVVILFSLRYFTFNSEVYVESQRAVYEAHVVGLMLHITGMVFALALGPFQFLRSLRNRHRSLHRTMGKVYIACALVGGLGGLYMSFYSIADIWSGVGFGLLAVGVLISTSQAYVSIRNRQIDEHREWMTRSFALILAAVTLRIYAPVLQIWVSEYTTFAIVGFLSWVPNILVAEWMIRRQRGRTRELALAPA